MSRYSKQHYDEIAKILAKNRYSPVGLGLMNVTKALADLFAADNPERCSRCNASKASAAALTCMRSMLTNEFMEHSFTIGFDREKFLAACGLEGEQEECDLACFKRDHIEAH